MLAAEVEMVHVAALGEGLAEVGPHPLPHPALPGGGV
jgi:hypothetical protein